MTKFRPRKPSASMVVAVLALIMALGGTSYAALSLPKNSVGSKQLKKNAVTTKKIKNGAVTGRKIKLSSLGTVPSATQAASATNAANVTGLKRYSGSVATPGASSSHPTSVTLGTFGPFTLLGYCYIYSGSGSTATVDAYTAVQTSEQNDWISTYYTTPDKSFNPSDGPLDVLETSEEPQGTQSSGAFIGPYDGSWAVANNSGTLSLNGFSNQGVYTQGASGPACSFSGFVVSS